CILLYIFIYLFSFFTDSATTEIYTLSLHDALPILEALIIGGYVRGLSDRDIESLADEAELGHVSKSTVSRICRELRDRYTAFCNKSLADLNVMALFSDAIYLPTRPSGQKEGVLVVWGYSTEGKRVLLAVRLGQRESHEDWLDLGRDLVAVNQHGGPDAKANECESTIGGQWITRFRLAQGSPQPAAVRPRRVAHRRLRRWMDNPVVYAAIPSSLK